MSYFYFIWKSHRNFLLFSMFIISLFQFLILRLVTTIDYSSTIMYLMNQLPENVQGMFGEDFISMLTVEGAAALALNHPLVLVILSILLLSFPVRRIKLLLNLFISAVVFLFLIILCALFSSILSISIFHQLTFVLFVKMLKISFNLWLLFVFIMSLTMVLSSFEKEGSKVGIRVAGITLVFYLLHYLSSLWDAIKFTKPFNIFTYYQPQDLMTGQRSFLLHVIVLSSLILLCLFISIYQFNRRDIPG